MISEETRARYKELRAEAEAATLACEPQWLAWQEARKPLIAIEEQIAELLDGEDVETCEGCGAYIFEDDKKMASSEDAGPLCVECAPTFADMLAHPENFMGEGDEPMTPEEAQRFVAEHVAHGGTVDDTMAI